MKLVVTYNVWGVPFRHEATSVHELYETVCAVIKHNKLMFPDQEATMSEYFKIVSDIALYDKISYENHIFKIERMTEE